jgi:hypothetical protein
LRISRRRAPLNLASWPLSLAGTVRRHARHVMMVMTMVMGADLHLN